MPFDVIQSLLLPFIWSKCKKKQWLQFQKFSLINFFLKIFRKDSMSILYRIVNFVLFEKKNSFNVTIFKIGNQNSENNLEEVVLSATRRWNIPVASSCKRQSRASPFPSRYTHSVLTFLGTCLKTIVLWFNFPIQIS